MENRLLPEDIIFNILDEQLNIHKQKDLRTIAHEIDLALDDVGYSDVRGLQDLLSMYQSILKTHKLALFNVVKSHEEYLAAENDGNPPTEQEIQQLVDFALQYAEKGEEPPIMVKYDNQ